MNNTQVSAIVGLLALQVGISIGEASFAQEAVVSGNAKVNFGPSIRSSEGRLRIGPDPSNRWELLPILAEPQVQTALQLSESQVTAIADIRGELKLRSDVLQRGPEGNPGFAEEFRIAKEVYRDKASKAVDELLTPEQLKRLIQIVFRMEIALLGYDGSLIHGRLGEVANIYENQYTHLASRTQEIMAEAETKINEIRREAEERVLAELSRSKGRKLKKALARFSTINTSLHLEMLLRKRERPWKVTKLLNLTVGPSPQSEVIDAISNVDYRFCYCLWRCFAGRLL